MDAHDSAVIWDAGVTLLGHGAPLRYVREFFDGTIQRLHDSNLFYASRAAFAAGALWAVDPVMTRHQDLTDLNLRVLVDSHLSWILEQQPGPIEDGPASLDDDPEVWIPEPREDHQGYAALVRKSIRRLRMEKSLRDTDVVIEGERLDLASGSQTAGKNQE